jgi:hypothetical protein
MLVKVRAELRRELGNVEREITRPARLAVPFDFVRRGVRTVEVSELSDLQPDDL